MKPIIGLTMHNKEGKLEINNPYIESIKLAGGIPICLPEVENKEAAQAILSRLDGLLVIGGHDVNPKLYNEPPHAKLGQFITARDESDMLLTKEAFRMQLPLLAICRGHQILNVAFGGSLIQDIPSQHPNAYQHSQRADRYELTHKVSNLSERLQAIFEATEIYVNTFHHQAVKQLGEGLIAAGEAEDGINEAIEHPAHPYCIGVQWHPEELAPAGNEHAQRLFKSFIQAATN